MQILAADDEPAVSPTIKMLLQHDGHKVHIVNNGEDARVLYRRRNEIERLFRRLKGYRRIFTRFDKLDVLFAGFILFALIVEALR